MPKFLSVTPSNAELARGEKSHTQSINQSITHPPSLFDVPGTEAFASEQVKPILAHVMLLSRNVLKSAETLSKSVSK